MKWIILNGTNLVKSYRSNNYYDINNIVRASANNDFDVTGTTAIDGDSASAIYSVVSGISAFTTEDQGITVYPNPAGSMINIVMNDVLTGTVNIQIYDAFGRQVGEEVTLTGGAAATQINVAHLAQGFYLLQMKNEQNSIVKRFVKE